MLNSFVANYLVQASHDDPSGLVDRGKPARAEAPSRFAGVRRDRRADASSSKRCLSARALARLQALAARCYGLSAAEFEHVLSTFPLIDNRSVGRALEEFRRWRKFPRLLEIPLRLFEGDALDLFARRTLGARKARAGVNVVDGAVVLRRRSGT